MPNSEHMTGNGPPNAIELLLRTLGIPADLQQRESIANVLAMDHSWVPSELAGVMAAILARSPRQQNRLQIELQELLQTATPATADRPAPAREADEPTGAHDEPARVTTVIRTLGAAIAKTPRRRVLRIAAGPMVSIVIAVLVWQAPSRLPVDIPLFHRDWAGSRDILFMVLGGLALTLPLGWLVEVIRGALPDIRKKLRRGVSVAFQDDRPGPAWFSPTIVARDAFQQTFTRRQTLAMGRAAPFRTGMIASAAFDPANSVRPTVASGVPALRFIPAREPWPVLILEDAQSGARGWSEMPQAIRTALGSTGLDVTLALCHAHDRFQMEDGSRIGLAGLLQIEALILIVSDGAALRGQPGGKQPEMVRTVERLAATRRAAWLDERERRDWHGTDKQFAIPGLLAWPATARGVEQALRHLGSENVAAPGPPRRRRRAPMERPAEMLERAAPATVATTPPSAILARGLGDALGWAAACAMIQPVGPGLAALLRAQFFAEVEPIAFGRMVALPGSTLTQSGLRFGHDLLDRLRYEFEIGKDPSLCKKILLCIRNEIERINLPPGAAHDSLRWYRARFLMDQSFGDSIEDLVALRYTPLGGAIARELQTLRLSDAPGAEGIIRLMHDPRPQAGGVARLAAVYNVHLAGSPIDVWQVLPGQPDRIPLPRHGVVAAISVGAAADKFMAVLLDDNAVLTQDGGRVFKRAEHPGSGTPGRDERMLFALSHDARFAADANVAGAGIRVRDLRADGNEPLLAQRDRWDQQSRMEGPLLAMAWSPVASILLVASRFEGLGVLDFTGPEPSVAWGDLGRQYTGIAFTPDGAAIVLVTHGDEHAYIRSAKAPLDGETETAIRTGLKGIEAVASGANVVAAAGLGRLVITGRDGAPIGSWQLSPGRVDAIALTDHEQAVAVLAEDSLRVIHAASGIDLLAPLPDDLRERRHAAIAIDRQIAALWSTERDRIDLYAMSRDDAVVGAAA